MWLNFFCAYIFIILMLFVPGFLFFRSLSFSKIESLLFAPLFSIAFLCIIGIAFNEAGLFSSAPSTAIPLFIIPTVCFLFSRKYRNRKKEIRTDWVILALYVVVGIAIGGYVYLIPLDGPESIIQTYDNVFHYNVVESFIESGSWSILSVDSYLGDQSFDPFPGASFYPAGWHVISAFAASAIQSSAPLAANATNFAFCSVVYPLSIFALLRTIFPSKPQIVAIGSIACCIQTAFPWSLYGIWPLLPNGASFCTCMLVASLFISALSSRDKMTFLPRYTVGFVLGLLSLAFLQPNTIFTLMAFLMPYVLWQIGLRANKVSPNTTPKAVKHCTAFLAIFVIALFIFFKLPFLQPTITYYWAPLYEPLNGLTAIMSWSLATETPQPQIAVLILCGIAYLICKNKKNCWLIASLLTSVFIFFIVSATPESPFKHFVGGYWYNDPYRIAAFCALFSTPITAIGVYAIACILCRPFKQKDTAKSFCCTGCSLLIAVATFAPNAITSQGFLNLRNTAYGQNSAVWNYLDYGEMDFVKKVKSVIPKDALIINQPFDGSMYAFGKSGINLYYRDNAKYGKTSGETAESRLIRKELKNIDKNKQVKEAVKKIGASYVLLLKPDFKNTGMYYPNYKSKEWVGIDGINDSTQGFELILEQDNMRLYKIDD